MMVVQIWNTSGILMYDSTQAAGGVCLGFYTVPAGGGEITFPEVTDVTGFAFGPAGSGSLYTSDTTTYGYLRFVFPPVMGSRTVAIFCK